MKWAQSKLRKPWEVNEGRGRSPNISRRKKIRNPEHAQGLILQVNIRRPSQICTAWTRFEPIFTPNPRPTLPGFPPKKKSSVSSQALNALELIFPSSWKLLVWNDANCVGFCAPKCALLVCPTFNEWRRIMQLLITNHVFFFSWHVHACAKLLPQEIRLKVDPKSSILMMLSEPRSEWLIRNQPTNRGQVILASRIFFPCLPSPPYPTPPPRERERGEGRTETMGTKVEQLWRQLRTF